MIESDGSVMENAILARLSGNWERRATVKRGAPALGDLFDTALADYPPGLTPFFRHPEFTEIDPESMRKALYLGAMAFHRHTMFIEHMIVEPTFAGLLSSPLPSSGPEFTKAVLQAAVDEQYHTLMHFNAAEVVRQNRSWDLDSRELPLPRVIERHRARRQEFTGQIEKRLVDLAFTIVVEISIDAYLLLVARDEEIQPVNSRTAAMHWRDEICHASISEELAKRVVAHLDPVFQDFFLTEIAYATMQFTAQDFSTWEKIVELAQIRDGRRLLAECREIPEAEHLIRDNSGVHKLWSELNDMAGHRHASPF